jgi:hypothetical protein
MLLDNSNTTTAQSIFTIRRRVGYELVSDNYRKARSAIDRNVIPHLNSKLSQNKETCLGVETIRKMISRLLNETQISDPNLVKALGIRMRDSFDVAQQKLRQPP